jgi:hypothetical protein
MRNFESMAAYARQVKDTELVKFATEIEVRTERKCGELLSSSAKNTGARGLGTSALVSSEGTPPTLADMGICAECKADELLRSSGQRGER